MMNTISREQILRELDHKQMTISDASSLVRSGEQTFEVIMQISTEEGVKPRQIANGLFVMSLIARGNPLLYQRLAGHASRMAGSQSELVRSYAAMHLVRTLDISKAVGFTVDRETTLAAIRQACALGIDDTRRESIESFLASLPGEE